MADIHIIQYVFQIVDELVATPENMANNFEGNGDNELVTTTDLKHENNDEHLVGLRDAC